MSEMKETRGKALANTETHTLAKSKIS